MLVIRTGLVLGLWLLLSPAWGQQRLDLGQKSRDVCPVCRSASSSVEYALRFHELHSDSLFLDNDALHTALTQQLSARTWENHDTLRYYALLLLGRVQGELKLHREALKTNRRVLDNWSGGHLIDPNYILAEMANDHFSLGDVTAARLAFRRVIESEGFHASVFLKDAVYAGMGLCFQYGKDANPDSAIFYFNRAVEVQMEQGDSIDLAKSYLNLGTIHYEQYHDAEAMELWSNALRIAQSHKVVDIMDDLHYNLAQLLEEQGDLKQSLSHYKQYLTFKDSLWNRDRLWQLAEQKRKFAVKAKNDEITILEQDKALTESELEQQKAERNVLLIAAIALVAVLGLIMVLYVITRQKNRLIRKQKDHLNELNATKDQLFSIVAHDLRSPVQSLGRNNLLLQQEIGSGDAKEQQALLQRNQQGIEGTYRLLDNLLHWSLSQTGSLFLQPGRQKVKALIDQVHYDFATLLEEKGILYTNEVPADCFVMADSHTLKIVLRNLLDNAIKFTPAGGSITFQPEQAGEGLRAFSICDSGPGIPEDRARAIFEIPARKDPGHDSSGKTSSGLGLYLCSELLKKNQGRIEAVERPGNGAQFTITLPKP